ncbi:hypothetical protein BDV26DRAFT_266679 [Aspergillus bertholletiae]|uniref:Secreted protein n=1 Tax=Aspergillus bertholletiae TaxID=1226010 RepID=A0A5N7B1R1_9EURO|nr:hypothetical protein BDV26DRAFT_266679 [Aspergillus bertholletiae]
MVRVLNAILLAVSNIHLSHILPFFAPFEIGGIAHVAFQNRRIWMCTDPQRTHNDGSAMPFIWFWTDVRQWVSPDHASCRDGYIT